MTKFIRIILNLFVVWLLSLTSCKKDAPLKPLPILPIAGNYNPLNIGTVRTYCNESEELRIDTISEIISGDSVLNGRIYKNLKIGFSNPEPMFCKEGNNYYEVYRTTSFNTEVLMLKDNVQVGTTWEDQLDFMGFDKIKHTVEQVNIDKQVDKISFKNVIHIRSIQANSNLIFNIIDSYYAKDIGLIYRSNVYNGPRYYKSSLINYNIK